jgi:hypothetical protein
MRDMTKPDTHHKTATATESPAEPPRREKHAEPKYTHLIGRARGNRPFTRAGIKFEPDSYTATPLSELDPERVQRILAETSMIDAQLGTEDDFERLGVAQRAELDERVPRSELVRHIQQLELRVSRADERIAKLEADRMADRPPKNVGDIIPGR